MSTWGGDIVVTREAIAEDPDIVDSARIALLDHLCRTLEVNRITLVPAGFPTFTESADGDDIRLTWRIEAKETPL